jgi:cyclic-di-GMP phosphodiesterase, flagellum assembly factor TipF
VSLRLEHLFVVGAVITVALSMALTLWAGAGLPWAYAALVALLVTALIIPLALRSQDGGSRRSSPELQHKLEANLAGLSRRLQEVERRLVELDHRMVDVSRTTVRAVATELDTVGSVMRDLAEAVALHDAELFAPRSGRDAAFRDPAAPPSASSPAAGNAPAAQARPAVAGESAAAKPGPAPSDAGSTPARATLDEVDAIAGAVRSEQAELMLQAIVTLPQRRVRLYEAQTRVRLPTGFFADSKRVMAVAEGEGLSRELDHFVLRHAMRVARHLASRNRDVPVVFRGSSSVLLDGGLFRLLGEAVASDPAFASRILFQLPLAMFRDADALEREALDALDQLGIRFVLDQVPDLVLEARSLAARGVRYIRVGAETLLGAAAGEVRAEIHPADLAGYLARHGLTLVVEGVASEQVSVELFEFDVPLGVGPLYAPPRSVRMDVLDEAAQESPDAQAAGRAAAGAAGAAPAPPAASPLSRVLPDFDSAASATPGPVWERPPKGGGTAASQPASSGPEDADAGVATQAGGKSLREFLRRTSG